MQKGAILAEGCNSGRRGAILAEGCRRCKKWVSPLHPAPLSTSIAPRNYRDRTSNLGRRRKIFRLCGSFPWHPIERLVQYKPALAHNEVASAKTYTSCDCEESDAE